MTADLLAGEPTRPLRRVEYDRLVEAGAFEGERLELIDGRLVVMSPESARHAAVVARLMRLLVLALDGRAEVRVGAPLAVSDLSEPEPDVAAVPLGDYSAAHPVTAHLAVEVSHSSLRRDRVVKPGLYAEAGVQEYWIVDLGGQAIVVLRGPSAGGYTSTATYTAGQRIALAAFSDVLLAVDDIL